MAATVTNTAVITTTTTTTQTNKGTKLTVTPHTDVQQVGNFVTDVSMTPYIRNTTVSFHATNLRPNTRVHAFFDGVLVDKYCAPGHYNETSKIIDKDDNWGATLKSDSFGRLFGHFNIPDNTFRFGDRTFEVTDTVDLVNGADAMTTVAAATLTASPYMSVTKQALTLTTINPQLSFTPVTNTITTTSTSQANVNVGTTVIPDTINLNYSWSEPLAQALTINTPNKEAGIFATSLDLYFQQKPDQDHGCTVYLCETKNGYPDGSKIIPYSTVHLDKTQINVDKTTASLATNFKFESPVYLSSNTIYAFVVKPDGGDPDYHIWTANLGNVDVSTKTQVYTQPALGTAFYGATTTQWTALQTEYVKFNLNIAHFSSLTGEAYFNNQDYDYIAIYNLQYANASSSILHGDVVYQSTNTTIATAQTSVTGIVDYYDDLKQVLYISNSSGNFTSSLANGYLQIHRFATTTSQTPNSSTYIAGANTLMFYNPVIDAIAPQFAHMEPSGTTLAYDFKGTSNSYITDSNTTPLSMGTETPFYNYERRVFSKSQESTLLSSKKSANVHVNFVSDSMLLSPVIDTVKANLLTIRNFVDPLSSIYEEFYNNGPSKTKYISKIITLASGQDAQDLNIILSAYRPPSSEIQVWVKFLNGEDPESMTNKTWTPMRSLGATLYSNPSNPNDYREFTFTVPYGYPLLNTTGTITTVTSSNTVTGSGTLFTSEVYPGWYINMKANNFIGETSRKILSVTSNTSLVLDGPFTVNHTNEPYFIVPPPTTAYLSQNTYVQLTGTVTTSTTNNSIIGSGTSFTGYFKPGSIIYTANDAQQVVSVANDTYLTVGTPWTTAASGSNVSIEQSAGVTYYNSSNSQFTTFKKFQIKIILQSNDSTKVPLIDNLRVMALQM